MSTECSLDVVVVVAACLHDMLCIAVSDMVTPLQQLNVAIYGRSWGVLQYVRSDAGSRTIISDDIKLYRQRGCNMTP